MEHTEEELKEAFDTYRLNCLTLGIDALDYDVWLDEVAEQQIMDELAAGDFSEMSQMLGDEDADYDLDYMDYD